MGTSGELSFVVKGEGVGQEVNQQKKAGFMIIKLNDYDEQINVKLQIGTVYKGSAVRDVGGKLDCASLQGKTISFVGAFVVDTKTEVLVTPIEIIVKEVSDMEAEVIHNDAPVVFHAEKISKIYPGTKALDEVSFDVYKGRTNVLIGANGAGKSTLLKIIAEIDQKNGGEVFMGDEKIHFCNDSEACAH